MKLRGMRDVSTVQTLADRSPAKNREQAVTELARLEHEKARLERELDIWATNQKKTLDRLDKVGARLALLRYLLEPPADEQPPRHARATRRPTQESAASEESEIDEAEGPAWREVPLEY